MRKPTKLGYCTTCNTKIYVFDFHGKPVRKKAIYREAMMLLSDGSRGKAAFCVKCLEDGVDAEEAIANLVDGMAADAEKKAWTEEFKQWYLSRYRPLKIMDVEWVRKADPNHGGSIPIDEKEQLKVKPFKKLYSGEPTIVKQGKPPERFADVRPS